MAMEPRSLNISFKIHWYWVAGLVMCLVLSRLIPHPPNFTALGAVGILAGATIRDCRMALLVPLVAMLISDAVLGFHSSVVFVYAAVAGIVVLNRYFLQRITVSKLVVTSVITAGLFFLVTNFGAWLSHDMYPRTVNGLVQAYIAGIPFFRNTLVSTLLFTAISFGVVGIFSEKKLERA